MLVVTDIRHVWGDIREKIQQCLQGQDLTAEELYHWCRAGKATLLMGDTAFFIVQASQNAHTDQMEFIVIVGYGEGEVVTKYQDYLKEMAQRAGCSKMVFVSRRKGFERKLTPEWKLKFSLYEMET